jgi:hypothetical protein
MKNKGKEFFSELDKKVIEELPMLIDIFANTFNKLNSFQRPISKKIDVFIKKHKPNEHQIIQKESYIDVFFPFSGSYNMLETREIINEFYIYSNCFFGKPSAEKSKRYNRKFQVENGFAIYEDEKEFRELHYVIKVEFHDVENLRGRQVLDCSFYENIKNDFFKEIDVTINHFTKGNESEFFLIEIPFSQIDKIEEYTDAFLEQIVTPFFKKLNTLK